MDIKLETRRYNLLLFFVCVAGICLQSLFYCKSGHIVIQNRYSSFAFKWPCGF